MEIPTWLDPGKCIFPDANLALPEPNGLLALGGSLAPEVLLSAYMQGVFPWYSNDQPILWWSPDPRAVLFPCQIKVSRSLQKTLKNGGYTVTFDQDFNAVIQACAAPRKQDSSPDSPDTWITAEMITAYRKLHQLGYAHSVEVWQEGQLVGGLYGLAIDRIFFGESMFHRRPDASKVGFVQLVKHLQKLDFKLIDCQQATHHLQSLGATTIPRQRFLSMLDQYCVDPTRISSWVTGSI